MPVQGPCYSPRVVEILFYRRSQSPVGPLFLAASNKGLVRLEFDARVQKLDGKKFVLQESETMLAPYVSELNEYFAGTRHNFSFPLDLRGTNFQILCWRALLAIPYGETCSYRDIAEAIGHPHAYRAVGMANNRNPIAIVVPCHRVIASSGSLCGYGGGLDLKRALLDLEQLQCNPENSRDNDNDWETNSNHRQFRLPLAIGA
jgi:O-6-methylguanine DNA methyltransferase